MQPDLNTSLVVQADDPMAWGSHHGHASLPTDAVRWLGHQAGSIVYAYPRAPSWCTLGSPSPAHELSRSEFIIFGVCFAGAGALMSRATLEDLTVADRAKATSLLLREEVKAQPEFVRQLELMLESGKKAEIESLQDEHAARFLSQTYLPYKLSTSGWL